MAPKAAGGKLIPCDKERIQSILKLIDKGNLNKILISQDVCFKIQLKKFGGYGYSHILENIVPVFLNCGMNQNEVKTLLINNPKELLAF